VSLGNRLNNLDKRTSFALDTYINDLEFVAEPVLVLSFLNDYKDSFYNYNDVVNKSTKPLKDIYN